MHATTVLQEVRWSSTSSLDWDEIYRVHAPDARRLAYLLIGDEAAAEDVVHDAFVKVAGRLVSLRSPGAVGTYLRRAVVNTAISRSRSRSRETGRLERFARSRPLVEAGATGDSRHDELWAALLRLPPRQRAAIVLRHWLDQSEGRTAELMGCGTGTVKSLVSRGLATLREDVPHA